MGRFELGTDGPTAILVGVDGSATSMRAAAYAVGQARRQRARLIGVYVRPRVPSLLALTAASAEGIAAAYAAVQSVEDTLRSTMEREPPRHAVEAIFWVRTGDPYTELTKAADESNADAVIIGASARPGHRWAGSLTVRLVRAGRWPVTVVP
jgi:nucleotide-binding universal stress UspA family protein